MYFTRLKKYNANKINITKDDACLICLESSTTNNNICKMKLLLSSYFYYQSCHCDGLFHYDCLLKWIFLSKSCPICRSVIETNTDINDDLPLTYNVYKILKIFKYLWMSILFRILINIMFNIQYTVERQIQNED
jgi:hypothetical protein